MIFLCIYFTCDLIVEGLYLVFQLFLILFNEIIKIRYESEKSKIFIF